MTWEKIKAIGFIICLVVIIFLSSIMITKETTQYIDCLGDIAQKHCGSDFVIEYGNTISIPAKYFQCIEDRQIQDTKYVFTDKEVERCRAT